MKATKVYLRKYPKKRMLYAARHRAKRLGIPFTITENDIHIPKKCPYFDVPFVIGIRDFAPSLDRIENEKGYTPGNIEVISHRANRIKSNLTQEQLLTFARKVLERFDT